MTITGREICLSAQSRSGAFEIYDISFPAMKIGKLCQDRTDRIAEGNESICNHVSTSFRHEQNVTDGVSRVEKVFPKWKK